MASPLVFFKELSLTVITCATNLIDFPLCTTAALSYLGGIGKSVAAETAAGKAD